MPTGPRKPSLLLARKPPNIRMSAEARAPAAGQEGAFEFPFCFLPAAGPRPYAAPTAPPAGWSRRGLRLGRQTFCDPSPASVTIRCPRCPRAEVPPQPAACWASRVAEPGPPGLSRSLPLLLSQAPGGLPARCCDLCPEVCPSPRPHPVLPAAQRSRGLPLNSDDIIRTRVPRPETGSAPDSSPRHHSRRQCELKSSLLNPYELVNTIPVWQRVNEMTGSWHGLVGCR